jgi:hypothetical protein
MPRVSVRARKGFAGGKVAKPCKRRTPEPVCVRAVKKPPSAVHAVHAVVPVVPGSPKAGAATGQGASPAVAAGRERGPAKVLAAGKGIGSSTSKGLARLATSGRGTRKARDTPNVARAESQDTPKAARAKTGAHAGDACLGELLCLGTDAAHCASSKVLAAQRHRAFTYRILRPTSEHAETTEGGTQVVTCATCGCELDRYMCGVCMRPFEAHDPVRDGHFPVSIVHFDKIIRSNVCYLHGRTEECMRMLKLAVRCFYGVVVPACVAAVAHDQCNSATQDAPGASGAPACGAVACASGVATAVQALVHMPGADKLDGYAVPVAVAVAADAAATGAGATSAGTTAAAAAGPAAQPSVSYLDDDAGKYLYDAHADLEQLCEFSAAEIVASECGQHAAMVLRSFAARYAARHAEWTTAQLLARMSEAEPAVQVHATVYDAVTEVLTEFALETEFGTSVQMLLKAKYRDLARRFPYFVHRAGQYGLPAVAATDADFVRRIRVKRHSLATKKLLRTTGTDTGLVAWAFRHFMTHLHGAMDGRPKTTRKWHRARAAAGKGHLARRDCEADAEDADHEEDTDLEADAQDPWEDEEEVEEEGEEEGQAAESKCGKEDDIVEKTGAQRARVQAGLQRPPDEQAERRRRVRQLTAVLISKLYGKTVSAIENCEIAHRQPASVLYPDDFVDTADGPVPKHALPSTSLLVAVVGATTGLLEGVIVNPAVGAAGTPDACPPAMVRKLHQVCEGLNSNVRRLNTHADVLAESFALERWEAHGHT